MSEWKHFAGLVIDAVEPSLRRRGKYLLDEREAELIDSGFASRGERAWTSRSLDLMLGDHLQATGQWQGRGFAVVVDRSQRSDLMRLAATIVHELAHWAANSLQASSEPVTDPTSTAKELRRWMHLPPAKTSKPPAKVPSWHQHGADYVRSVCHYLHRTAKLIPSIEQTAVFDCGRYYPGFQISQFMTSLKGELVSRQSEPIPSLLRSPPPSSFDTLWHRAAGRTPAKALKRVAFDYAPQKRIVRQAGKAYAMLATEQPQEFGGGLEVLLMDGVTFRNGKNQIPLTTSSEYAQSTVREIVGSVRNIRPVNGELVGVATFASDPEAQAVARLYDEGHLAEFGLWIDRQEGIELKAGQRHKGFEGPITLVTRWVPMAASCIGAAIHA